MAKLAMAGTLAEELAMERTSAMVYKRTLLGTSFLAMERTEESAMERTSLLAMERTEEPAMERTPTMEEELAMAVAMAELVILVASTWDLVLGWTWVLVLVHVGFGVEIRGYRGTPLRGQPCVTCASF